MTRIFAVPPLILLSTPIAASAETRVFGTPAAHPVFDRMDRFLSIDLACAALVVLIGNSARAEPVTASFTDSQGRTMLYRYSLEGLPPRSSLNAPQSAGPPSILPR